MSPRGYGTLRKMALFFTGILLQFVVLGLIMQAIGPVIDSSIGMVAGGARDLLGRRPQIRTHLDKAAATVFAALAVGVVVEVPA